MGYDHEAAKRVADLAALDRELELAAAAAPIIRARGLEQQRRDTLEARVDAPAPAPADLDRPAPFTMTDTAFTLTIPGIGTITTPDAELTVVEYERRGLERRRRRARDRVIDRAAEWSAALALGGTFAVIVGRLTGLI